MYSYLPKLGAAVLFSFLALSGCALGPEHSRPNLDLPEQWKPGTADSGAVRNHWWELFQDPTLDALVDRALSHNHDLELAMARVEEARARLGIARSAQLPLAGIQAGAARGETGGTDLSASYETEGSISFTIDLWGKYRRATEAARARLLSTEAAYRTVGLSVAGDTARAYFLLLSIDQQLETAHSTLKARRRTEELYRSRYKEGLSGEFELRQSEVETTTAMAQVQSLEIARVQTETALGVLIGQSPRQLLEERIARPLSLDKVNVPELVPAGLPSGLIARRPDIMQAEQELHAATADIGVARAAFFPDLSLTGVFGWASSEFDRLIMTGASHWSVGANVLQPVFQGGKLFAELEAANARQKAAYAGYAKVVQNAFREVHDSLTANRITRERLKTIQTQVTKLRRAMELANLRYTGGQTGFLEVLDAQRALFNAEMELARAHQAQLDAAATLYQVLGGGWQ